MDARSLSDERLERLIQNTREVLRECSTDNPQMLRSILRQAEAERDRRREERSR